MYVIGWDSFEQVWWYKNKGDLTIACRSRMALIRLPHFSDLNRMPISRSYLKRPLFQPALKCACQAISFPHDSCVEWSVEEWGWGVDREMKDYAGTVFE